MTTQQYLMISTATNVVENVCMWDGDANTWQPPVDTLMLIQADIPTMIWEAVIVDKVVTDYVLVEQLGQAGIGFTWDGTVCTTNQPKPVIPA
jgi:hypothetical protein